MGIINRISYPNGLPLPQAEFSGGIVTPTQTTTFTSGKVRKRKIGRTVVKKATLNWLFTPDEFDLFESFFVNGLNCGCAPFDITMCTGGSSQTGLHVVQFVGDSANFSHEECNWRVSMECIIYPYPRPDDGIFLQDLLGANINLFSKTMSMYYDKGYMQ